MIHNKQLLTVCTSKFKESDKAILVVTLNNASDYRTNGLYRTVG